MNCIVIENSVLISQAEVVFSSTNFKHDRETRMPARAKTQLKW